MMLEGNKPPVREAALLCGDGQESSSSLRRRGLGAAGLGPGGRSGAVAGPWQRSGACGRAVAELRGLCQGCGSARGLWQRSAVVGTSLTCVASAAGAPGPRGAWVPAARRGEARCGPEPSGAQLLLFMLRGTEAHTAEACRQAAVGCWPWGGRQGPGRPGAFGRGPLALPGPWRWARGIVSLRTRRSSSARRASSLLALLGRPWQSSGSRFSLFHLENNSEIPEKG